ncbi:MAG: hypothetical protein F6J93_27825 [Oscillatoria sp. SIO1A7]|nr:hypothetical protein [Oscillatoria sp. SIO1A7]
MKRLLQEIEQLPAFQELDWHRRAIADHAGLSVGNLMKPLGLEQSVVVDKFAQQVLANHPYWLESLENPSFPVGFSEPKARPSVPDSQCPLPGGQCPSCGHSCSAEGLEKAKEASREMAAARGEFLLEAIWELQKPSDASDSFLIGRLFEEAAEIERAIASKEGQNCQTALVRMVIVCLGIYKNTDQQSVG